MPKRRKKKIITDGGEEVKQDEATSGFSSGRRKKTKKPRVKHLNEPEAENFQAVQPPAASEAEDSEREAERKKKLITWAGISCIMVAILAIWLLNINNEFRISAKKSAENKLNFSQAKAELNKAMGQVKQGIEQIKQIRNNASSTLSDGKTLTPKQIDLLKGKLLNEIATTTATSTANSTVKN